MKARRVDTWVAPMEDQPGGLAAKLKALARAGVDLEFVIARRAPDKPGTGVVFITPIVGAKQSRAARAAGFRKTSNLHTVRIEGQDKPGTGTRITEALADAGVNLRGLSAAAIGRNFICHVAVDTDAAAVKALRIVRDL